MFIHKNHVISHITKPVISGLIAASLLFPLVGMAQTHTDDALYQALGKEAGISRIVDGLLTLSLKDDRIKESFKDTDMRRLALLLKEQFCVLSHGPCTYTGDEMKIVHENLGIRSAQFNALAEDLQIVMENLHISSHIQNQLIAKLAPMKKDIVFPKKADTAP